MIVLICGLKEDKHRKVLLVRNWVGCSASNNNAEELELFYLLNWEIALLYPYFFLLNWALIECEFCVIILIIKKVRRKLSTWRNPIFATRRRKIMLISYKVLHWLASTPNRRVSDDRDAKGGHQCLCRNMWKASLGIQLKD